MPPTVSVADHTVVPDEVGLASSLSVRLTVVVASLPTVTPAGSVPNPSESDSPSSSSPSSTATTTKVVDVAPAAKVRLAGTPLKSAASAPPCGVAVSGIVTSRCGSALRLTVTVTPLAAPSLVAV